MDGSALNPGKTGFLICNITVCLLTVNLSYRKMGDLQWEKEEKEEFIHVLIKFYAVLEECMPVEENLRKRFRNQMISINLLKLPSSQGIVGEKSFVASR